MADTKKLLNTVVTGLLKVLEEGEDVITKEGEVVHQAAGAAYYAQAINVLKMLGETGLSDKPTLKKRLAEISVPFATDDAETHPENQQRPH